MGVDIIIGCVFWFGAYKLAKWLFTRALVARVASLEDRLGALERRE